MTENLEIFSNLDESVESDVTVGNENKVEVKGKGNINILTRRGRRKIHLMSTLFPD